MLSGLLKKFTRQKKSSDTAKKRLQFSLIYDKLEVNDTTLENLQTDIVNVISKYFEIDKDALELKVKRDDEVSALVFNTPILHVKRKKAAGA
ncbi:MAG: cell division topological specificity factor MinE [Desulfobacterales bacterium]|nr:MAG: cell division topological specificity factor MinE [Desulfobacterales bacterium]